MKLKNNLLVATIFGVTVSIAQQAPTGFGVNGFGVNASTFWARGG